MAPRKIENKTRSEEEKVISEMSRILSGLSPKEFKETLMLADMPNDTNYVWSEEDREEISKIFDFKKIQKIKYEDPRVKKLQSMPIKDYFLFEGTNEGLFEAEYGMAYLLYKYGKINNTVGSWIYLTNEVLKRNFFEKFLEELEIPKDNYIATYRFDNKKFELGNLWINFGKVFLHYDGNGAYIVFPAEYKNFAKEENELGIILGIIKSYKVPKIVKNKIYIVFKAQYGFEKKDFTLKRVKNINLGMNYNDGFEEVSHDIITKLNNKKKTGLVILHGVPGTGKTSFIRYLAGKLKRNIIFISPDMVHHITEPEFIPFLMENSDAILILEDAEVALQKRDSFGRTGAVSNILNLTDGLLSDCLNISIVATFNTETKNIDEALLRKGRLLKAYKFDKLSVEKSKALLLKEGKDISNITKPMSLAEIYYFEDEIKGNVEAFSETKRIGFGNSN